RNRWPGSRSPANTPSYDLPTDARSLGYAAGAARIPVASGGGDTTEEGSPCAGAAEGGARGRRSCMPNTNDPAVTTGGNISTSEPTAGDDIALADLPAKVRVHALAKL